MNKYVLDYLYEKLNVVKPTISFILDLAKASDIVRIDILLKKCQSRRGEALQFLDSYLKNRSQSVKINDMRIV